MCTDPETKTDRTTSEKQPKETEKEKQTSDSQVQQIVDETTTVQQNDETNGKQIEQIFEIVYLNNGDRRPHAIVEVRERKRTGLLDTGAQASIVSEDCLEEMELWSDQLMPTERIIATADATRHTPKGKMYVEFVFNDIRSTIPVLVGPIGRNRLILGVDFKMAYGIRLDLPAQKYCMSHDPETRHRHSNTSRL